MSWQHGLWVADADGLVDLVVPPFNTIVRARIAGQRACIDGPGVWREHGSTTAVEHTAENDGCADIVLLDVREQWCQHFIQEARQ